jgi:glyoxylase-like metal-dependent hydrolase (beta-lactamase superfamily II)
MIIRLKGSLRAIAVILLAAAGSILAPIIAAQAPPVGSGPTTDSMIPENSVIKVSDHVYTIVAFPNIGFVVGNRSILVVDTGLGPRNGAIVAKEAAKLAPNHTLYLTTTHFHPEHASGDSGFPSSAILIRPAVQQKELEGDQNAMIARFSGMSAQNKELLQDVKFRKPDILFDKEITLDLGGVTARLFWMGTAHTVGDEMIFVEPDKTLIPGDIVQNKMLPNLPAASSRLNSWIEILGQLRSLGALHVLPDHGSLGDGSLVGQEYAFLSDLQSRALELKRQGKSAADAGQTVLAEFKAKYADWPSLNGIPGLVAHVYSENP